MPLGDEFDVSARSILLQGEGNTLDFKRELNLDSRGKYELAKDCSGFANSKGGLIIYGISEKPRIVVGISNPLPKETIIQVVETRTYPPLIVGVESKPLQNGRYLGIIHVPESKSVHEIMQDRAVYVRHGSITEKAVPREIHRLYDERSSPSRTVFVKPTRVINEDNSALMLPDNKQEFRVCKKRGYLSQLAQCPLFLPDSSIYGRFPRFGVGNFPLAIGFSHAPALTARDFIDRARQVEKLVRSMPWYFSTISLTPRLYWSISDDGEFAYGCGVNKFQKAIRAGLKGAVSMAVCGEFLGSINKSSLLLVISGYCRYGTGQPPLIAYTEISLYLSFLPTESDWVRTLLKPFLFGDRRIFHTLAYEPQRVELREWRLKREFEQVPKIKGVIHMVKSLPKDDFTEIDAVIADCDWYRAEEFLPTPASFDRENSLPTRPATEPLPSEVSSHEVCPLEVLDEAPVMLTNPLVSLEEVKQGSPDGVDSFDYPNVSQFKVPGYGHTIYIISVTAKASARQGAFSKQAREAKLQRFLGSFDIPGITRVGTEKT